jgi:hypothetical protein
MEAHVETPHLDSTPARCDADVPYTIHAPPPPDDPPWRESLLREYDRRLGEYRALDQQDRPGIPADQRERLAAAKEHVFGEAAIVRAKAVNDFLTCLRWAMEDCPGVVEAILSPAIAAAVGPSFAGVAADIRKLARRRRGTSA